MSLLLVEDTEDQAVLVRRQLETATSDAFELTVVDRLSKARDHLLADDTDCVLLDLTLPDGLGLETVDFVRSCAPEVPIVVLSSRDDEHMATESLHRGVQDYLIKGRADGSALWRAIRYAVDRKHSERMIRYKAAHDILTGLANRSLFVERLGTALRRLSRRRSHVAVLFLDLDRFKWINDSLGHEAGDQVIIEVANRISSLLRPSDLAARLGGDEFLVLLEDVGSQFDAIAVAERIQGSLAVPIMVGEIDIRVTASIGISLSSQPDADPHGLVRDADAAMYRAKDKGKARSELFDNELREIANTRLQMESDLRRGVDRREFVVHYQPVVDLTDGHVAGAEALVRWMHPSGQLVAPENFLPVAEETGIIVEIGYQVLEASCALLSEWRSPAGRHPILSVNLSGGQLADADLVARVDSAIKGSGIAPRQLLLEVTETSLLSDEGTTLTRLRDLKGLGVRLGFDDFGTGFSSLTSLKRYPFDVLKIDRSSVVGLGEDGDDTAVLGALMDLARALHLHVIVEGVETDEQARRLRQLGCELAQGFLFAPATSPDELSIS